MILQRQNLLMAYYLYNKYTIQMLTVKKDTTKEPLQLLNFHVICITGRQSKADSLNLP